MNVTFTPGPWYVSNSDHNERDEETPERPSILAPDGNSAPWHICRIDGGLENAQANARLIAAAPELLEALELAEDALTNAGYREEGPSRKAIQAAIAKAKGGEA